MNLASADRSIPSPPRASGTSVRSRCARTRSRSSSASSPRSGSGSGAGWPAADGGEITDLAIWAVPFGMVGGRLYHVITDWQLYFPNNPWGALYVWRGGLGIWGAIALGAVGVAIGARRKGIRLLPVLDAIAPGVLVAQALGRWGNYFNQELFGRPDRPAVGAGDRPGLPARGLLRRRDLPPDVPLRVPVVPGRVRGGGVGRPPVPARPRPGGGALRHGLHRRARLDRGAADRRRRR